VDDDPEHDVPIEGGWLQMYAKIPYISQRFFCLLQTSAQLMVFQACEAFYQTTNPETVILAQIERNSKRYEANVGALTLAWTAVANLTLNADLHLGARVLRWTLRCGGARRVDTVRLLVGQTATRATLKS